MEKATNELAEKIKKINEESSVIELRLVNTRKHVEHIENEIEKIKHRLFLGFHTVNSNVRKMEEDIKTLSEKLTLVFDVLAKIEKKLGEK